MRNKKTETNFHRVGQQQPFLGGQIRESEGEGLEEAESAKQGQGFRPPFLSPPSLGRGERDSHAVSLDEQLWPLF